MLTLSPFPPIISPAPPLVLFPIWDRSIYFLFSFILLLMYTLCFLCMRNNEVFKMYVRIMSLKMIVSRGWGFTSGAEARALQASSRDLIPSTDKKIIVSKCIHLPTSDSSLLSTVEEQYFILYKHISFIYLSFDGHISCFVTIIVRENCACINWFKKWYQKHIKSYYNNAFITFIGRHAINLFFRRVKENIVFANKRYCANIYEVLLVHLLI